MGDAHAATHEMSKMKRTIQKVQIATKNDKFDILINYIILYYILLILPIYPISIKCERKGEAPLW